MTAPPQIDTSVPWEIPLNLSDTAVERLADHLACNTDGCNICAKIPQVLRALIAAPMPKEIVDVVEHHKCEASLAKEFGLEAEETKHANIASLLTRLSRSLERARKALDKYGVHDRACQWGPGEDMEACDCGLRDAIRSLSSSPPKEMT